METKDDILRGWDISWPIIDVLIGGKSSIDLSGLNIRNLADAKGFLVSYGYNPDLPGDRQLLHAIIIEALSFIEKQLMPEEWRRGVMPPDEVLLCDDVATLLLMASRAPGYENAPHHWACAVLRVMHTIAHIEGVQKVADTAEAVRQIKDRFSGHWRREADGTLWLGSVEDNIFLERVEWKEQKSRNSVILKLLHKRGNVAETLYDLIGVRIVTPHLGDTLRVVRYLEKKYLISFPNCYPTRSRNTLFDLDGFHAAVEEFKRELEADKISPSEFVSKIAELRIEPKESEKDNPHSSNYYKAIQFTCRQLIRWPNPAFQWLAHDGVELTPGVPEATAQRVLSWNGVRGALQMSAFFPFEIQIMDKAAYFHNQFGDASHDRYKRAQTRTARRRILSAVLDL